MDLKTFLALLLYFNVFYFGVFAVVEFSLLVLKAFNAPSRYDSTTLINELLVLTFMTVVETVRLMMGQQATDAEAAKVDFDKRLSVVFRVLVLTVPSMYAVAYLALWQAFVSRLDFCLGIVMLVIQAAQLFSSFAILLPKFVGMKKAN